MVAEDQECIRAFLAGDERSFDRLVHKYRVRMLRYCFFQLGNREDAEECAMDAFRKSYFALKEFRFQSSFLTWLYTIARNTCIDRKKSLACHPRFERLDAQEPSGATIPGDAESDRGRYNPQRMFLCRELQQEVASALSVLSAEQELAMTLWLFEGLSYAQIAETMRASEGKVKTLLHRSRKVLIDHDRLQELVTQIRSVGIEAHAPLVVSTAAEGD